MKRILLLLLILTISTAYGKNNKDLNFINISNYLDSIGIKYKEIVIKQICLETNFLKHKKAIKKQNLLGLVRNKRLIKFENWRKCLDFYKSRFQDNIKSDICYYTYLKKRRYAKDKHYIKKLKKIKVKHLINGREQTDTTERGSTFLCQKS